MKASAKEQTEFQPKLLDQAPSITSISGMRTDDIFTNLLIQHGRKAVEDDENADRSDRLTRYGQVSGERIKRCSEIFIPTTHDESNPRSILVTGKAGIGKTLFCQRLLRDWADNRLFQAQKNPQLPDFKFAYLLTFKNLNLLVEEELTLKDVLERCSFLDDQCLRSNIDTFPLEYILNHSEEVLIIIDGFDEYSKEGQDYIAGDCHEEYPNYSERKMKVAALCAKLIRKKILKQATIMITSRSDESDKLSKIEFDRIAEVTGFSEQQVTEYIERYFRQNESFKRTVLEHITKNENLVSFAHIPVLCALMCSYFEYILKKSTRLEDLPVSVRKLYDEVLNIFTTNHIEKKIPNFIRRESTLDVLSKFAADSLLKGMYLFEEEEMKRLTSEEIVEKLRICGLLHCGPPFNVSFSEKTKYFCFSHLTLHEYLAARWFVKEKTIPLYGKVSTMVYQFIAGILSKREDSVLMDELMKKIITFSGHWQNVLLQAKCLNEYQNKEYAKKHLSNAGNVKSILFLCISNVDITDLLFLLDVFSSLNEDKTSQSNQQQPSNRFRGLSIVSSSLTPSRVGRICRFLQSNVTDFPCRLSLMNCGVNDEFIQYLCGLVLTKPFKLDLSGNDITDAGASRLSKAVKQSTMPVTSLCLNGTQITDVGVASLSEALKQSTCQLTTLNLIGNKITDVGAASLSEALKQSTCQLTVLHLNNNQIAEAGATSLSEALKQSTCQVTTLILTNNQITDVAAASLIEAVKLSTCHFFTLNLAGNKITDAGAVSLSEALTQPTCQLKEPHLGENRITDARAASISKVLKRSSYHEFVIDQNVSDNQITDEDVGAGRRKVWLAV